MTAQDQLNEIATAYAATLIDMGKTETDSLTSSEQTRLTDRAAEILNDTNPNHNYPPVPKS